MAADGAAAWRHSSSAPVSLRVVANKKISQLPVAAALTGAELVPVVQAGGTVRASLADLPVSDAVQAALDAITEDASGEVAAVSAALAALTALVATDAELAAAVSTLSAGIAAKQDAATAATDAELASAIATINAAMATDAELASAVSTLNTSLGLKQDAITAATDAELAAAVAAINAVIATDAELTAAVAAHNASGAAHADIRTLVSAESTARTSADTALDGRLATVESRRAVDVPSDPFGTVAATNVQAALEEVKAEAGGTPGDASTTVKGITKLSVAPTSPSEPIALGANEKGSASGVATLNAGSRVVQAPKLHASDHTPGGADPLTLAPEGLWTPIATAVEWGNSYGGTAGNSQSVRLAHFAIFDCEGLRCLYVNAGRGFSGAVEGTGADEWRTEAIKHGGNLLDAISVKTSVGVEALNAWRPSFNGARTGRLDPGCVAVTDPQGPALARNGVFYSRHHAIPLNSGIVLGGRVIGAGGVTEGHATGVGVTDYTDSAAVPPSGSANVFAPVAILGHVAGQLVSTIGIGDSNMWGNGLGQWSWANLALSKGLPGAHAAGAVPFLNCAVGNALAKLDARPSDRRIRESLARHFTHALIALSTNDIIAGDALNVRSYLIAIYTGFRKPLIGSRKVIAATTPPYCTSTDSFATVVNQTPALSAPHEAQRLADNVWILSLAAGLLDAAVDTAGAVAAVGDLSRWNARSETCNFNGSVTTNILTNATGTWRVGDTITSTNGGGPNINSTVTAVSGAPGALTLTLANSYSGTATTLTIRSIYSGDGIHYSATGRSAAAAALNLPDFQS